MAVRIRLTRLGRKKKAYYRIIVADSESKRDGKFLDIVGTYDPLKDPAEITINQAKLQEWLGKGGVLITTEVAADDDLVAAALDHVDVCISYDLPASLGHLQDRVGRFQRASRAADVTIAWLRDTSRSFAWEEDLLGTMAGWLPPTR